MDNVTHAFAGLLLAEATVALAAPRLTQRDTFREAALLLGVIAAELPDVDVFYASRLTGIPRLGSLLHHRGHTHTIVAAVLGALLVSGVALALRRSLRAPAGRWWLLALCMAGTLSHLALDWTNSYGVHPFWPADDRWYYGDAVFIVEPWLWIAAVPPLLLATRRVATRVVLGALLGVILVAAWRVGMVARGVAAAYTLVAAAWTAIVAASPARRRAALGVGAWCVVEAVFVAASAAARGEVRSVTSGATRVDVVLSPAVGDPLCFGAIVVEADSATYRVTTAAVAPLPGVQSADACAGRAPSGGLLRPTARAGTRAVRWLGEWSAPRAELASLDRTNCVVAAALRFIHVPYWSLAGESVTVGDVRYDRGGGGFATVVAPARPDACPTAVPPWREPREALLAP